MNKLQLCHSPGALYVYTFGAAGFFVLAAQGEYWGMYAYWLLRICVGGVGDGKLFFNFTLRVFSDAGNFSSFDCTSRSSCRREKTRTSHTNRNHDSSYFPGFLSCISIVLMSFIGEWYQDDKQMLAKMASAPMVPIFAAVAVAPSIGNAILTTGSEASPTNLFYTVYAAAVMDCLAGFLVWKYVPSSPLVVDAKKKYDDYKEQRVVVDVNRMDAPNSPGGRSSPGGGDGDSVEGDADIQEMVKSEHLRRRRYIKDALPRWILCIIRDIAV